MSCRWIQRIRARLGRSKYRSYSTAPVFDDPTAGERHDGPMLLHAPIEHGRTMRIRGLDAPSHPHVAAARSLWEQPDRPERARAILASYYESTCPPRFADWVGVDVEGSVIAGLPPRVVPFPWAGRSIHEQAATSQRVVEREARVRGVRLDPTDYWPPLGPMSGAGIELELDRLAGLVKSVRRSGFRTIDPWGGVVSAWILLDVDTGAWCWQVKSGNHRAAVAAAIGIRHLDVRPRRPIVRRSEAASWPGVDEGLYSVDEARRVFDRVLRG